jgi:hypothetical protein
VLRKAWDKLVGNIPKQSTDLGSLLLRMDLVTEQQLQEAVLRQRALEKDRTRIGEVLIQMGAISRNQLADALAKQRLMRAGKATHVMAELAESRLDALAEHIKRTTTSEKA